jgi:hypothetical protein
MSLVKNLVESYVKYPNQPMQGLGYPRPITNSMYEKVEKLKDRMKVLQRTLAGN